MSQVQPSVLYEDNHLLVIDKPAGMLSQGDRTGDDSLLDWGKDWLRQRYGKPGEVYLGLVQRLDRPVSGVIAFARTSKGASRLSAAIRERQVGKVYWALVEGGPAASAGRLEGWLLPGRGTAPSRMVEGGVPGAQEARLAWRQLGQAGGSCLLEIDLETGRKHQIRTQLAAAGWPVRGDRRYGARQAWAPGNIALHARELRLPHPVGGKEMVFRAPVPAAWALPPGIVVDQDG